MPDAPPDFQVYIKRDDLTSAELSGNKVRNLQLLFADALGQGCRHVIMVGGEQSGLCRATALIARSLGLTPHIIVHDKDYIAKAKNFGSEGNALLIRMTGSHVYVCPFEVTKQHYNLEKMETYIRTKYGELSYCVPFGGATLLGMFGFLQLFQELLDQGLHDRFDDVVVTIGSGLTAAGLAIANYLTGSKVKIPAVSVFLPKVVAIRLIDQLLDQAGLDTVRTDDILDIITDYIGDGYAVITDQVLEYMATVCYTTGIVLDPYYTGKGAYGMLMELKNNPARFNGKRILFIHTGGMF